ncbi:MAG: TetR/AcrR family transcriptional regulator [Dokdonella sp.]
MNRAKNPSTPAAARRPRAPLKRSPGRPLADSPDQRLRLLDAALVCFARAGMAATPLRAIAAEAGVTPAMLHYYFGDKTQLQQAVIAERLLPTFARLRETLMQTDGDVAALIAAFVRGIEALVTEHPWLPSLWVREVLCEGGALRELLVSQIAPALPLMLAQRFAMAQRQGRINADLDPRLLVVSLIGLTMFPAAGAPIWRRIFDADDIDAAALRRHTIALLDRGIGVD